MAPRRSRRGRSRRAPKRSHRGRSRKTRRRTTRRQKRQRKARPTIKRANFLTHSFGAKRVQSLPGIGPAYGKMLKICGYMKANRVIKRYLALRRNKKAFIKWLRKNTGANEYHANQCYDGIQKWVKTHLGR